VSAFQTTDGPICPRCKTRRMTKANKTKAGKQRWECKKLHGRGKGSTYCYSTVNPALPSRSRSNQTTEQLVFKRKLEETKRYIITAAQNATPVHLHFMETLKNASKKLSANLVIIPLRYQNPTSVWSKRMDNQEWWAPEVLPYLHNQRLVINENLMVLGDIKTVPTASSPLTGFDVISGLRSAILGHAKVQLRTIATPQNKMAKILTTTGVCTKANYTDSRAGKLGEFHHSLSAVIVEVQGKIFHLRHVHADKTTGEFTDLETRYAPDGSRRAERPLALVMGDTHVDFIDPKVERATFADGGMVDVLRPKTLVWHDLLDAYSVNPHHYGNPFASVAKRTSGRDNARAEVLRAIRFVEAHAPRGTDSVIVASNHDDFLRRWICSADWKQDPTNAEFYLETALAMVRGTRLGPGGTEYPSPFPYWVSRLSRSGIRCLAGREPYVLGQVELGMHGDRGPNGARGSIRNLRRIGVRSIIGHTHSPGIDEGCYQVGTSTALSLEYNSGPSGWLNTHCILHADGKRQLINIINGEWRL
jgi:hypothetical protein